MRIVKILIFFLFHNHSEKIHRILTSCFVSIYKLLNRKDKFIKKQIFKITTESKNFLSDKVKFVKMLGIIRFF